MLLLNAKANQTQTNPSGTHGQIMGETPQIFPALTFALLSEVLPQTDPARSAITPEWLPLVGNPALRVKTSPDLQLGCARSAGEIPGLNVVIQEKLVRMRPQPKRIRFFPLGGNPHLEKIAGENIALEQELVVAFESFYSVSEASWHLGHF